MITKGGVSPTMSIRGISSDSTNAGFDQSVGLIIDGVFYDRARWTDQGYLDVAQVEILKGPQALFFGKSTVAGALVMTTANPGDEVEGRVTLGHEFEASQWYTEGMISGPLSDTFGARLALRYSDSDGWLENQAPVEGYEGEDFGAEEELTGRLTLAWDPSDTLSLNFKAQYSEQETDGPATRGQLFNCRGPSPFGTEITNIPADTGLAAFGAYYPITDDCKLNDTITVYPGAPGVDHSNPPQGDWDSLLTSLNINWDLGSWALTSVTGYNDYDLQDTTGYISSQGLISAKQKETNESFSQELRLASEYEGALNFMLGFNYQDSEFHFNNASMIILNIPDSRNGRTDSQEHDADQDSQTVSVFGEIVWDITDQLKLSGGARYTDVEKDATYNLFFVNEWFETVFGFPFWLPEGTVLDYDFEDDNVSPQVTLEWQPREGMNVFASYREGYLPGGFSLGATPQAGLELEDFLFDSEEVEGFEVGFKSVFMDGRMSVDIIAFDYEYKELQVNIYVPETASFVVGNAPEATTTGVEMNLRWQASEYLSLRGLVTYNKGEYGEYTNQCDTLQVEGCDALTGTQDMDGEALPRAPEYTFGLGAYLTVPLGGAVLDVAADANWSDDYTTETTNNPALVQESFWRFDASASLATEDGRWRVTAIGRNLSDEDILGFGATRGFTNDQLGEVLPMRSYSLELSYSF
jgi:outer membrane receptor protein involved in Fe transport